MMYVFTFTFFSPELNPDYRRPGFLTSGLSTFYCTMFLLEKRKEGGKKIGANVFKVIDLLLLVSTLGTIEESY